MFGSLLVHWGDIASISGVIVSLIGLAWAIIVAKGARSASQAARQASIKTNARIAGYLQTVDVERAIGLIQRIKLLHGYEQWGAALEHYQQLRAMLSNIIVRCHENEKEHLQTLATARAVLITIENLVARRWQQGIPPRIRDRLQQQLNAIQSDLEELASNIGFGDDEEEYNA